VKFFIDNIWLILLVLLSGGALAWPALSRSKFAVSTLQATQLLNKGKVQVVDVRTPEEFAALDAAGIERVGLGPHVLRVETAAIAVAARLA
jgi:hypothetical protein